MNDLMRQAKDLEVFTTQFWFACLTAALIERALLDIRIVRLQLELAGKLPVTPADEQEEREA